ncbi:tRNA (cytidine(34)-2'-O)-methyltransferase [Lautropia mirabilis]
MFHVVLVQPEIPPNTGNVIRLCANTGCALHLIKPLGFPIDHAKMRRAGLDYHEFTAMTVHKNWAAFLDSMQASMAAASGSGQQATPCQPPHSNARQIPFSGRLYGLSTSGHKSPYDHRFLPGDCLVFGRETSGLPDDVQDSLGTDHLLRLPMRPHNRSLNLSNAVAVTVFEAWRQQGFEGAAD